MKVTIEPTVPRLTINVVGSYFRVRSASAAFDLKIESQTYNGLEAGDQVTRDKPFRKLTFINLSADDDLVVEFYAGEAGGAGGGSALTNTTSQIPSTRMVGSDIALAQDDSQDFPGVDEFGKRRKQFTLTVGPDIQGSILVFDADTSELLAIISTNETAGVGFAIETDANLRIINCTDENPISSAGVTFASPPDIAVAETFYR